MDRKVLVYCLINLLNLTLFCNFPTKFGLILAADFLQKLAFLPQNFNFVAFDFG